MNEMKNKLSIVMIPLVVPDWPMSDCIQVYKDDKTTRMERNKRYEEACIDERMGEVAAILERQVSGRLRDFHSLVPPYCVTNEAGFES